MDTFSLSEHRLSGETTEIRIAGEFDAAVAIDLESAIGRADGVGTLLVNLGRCEFIDSVGVTLLLRARQRLEGRGARMLIAGQSGQVRRVLDLTGVVPALSRD